jgi:hypothetical protein
VGSFQIVFSRVSRENWAHRTRGSNSNARRRHSREKGHQVETRAVVVKKKKIKRKTDDVKKKMKSEVHDFKKRWERKEWKKEEIDRERRYVSILQQQATIQAHKAREQSARWSPQYRISREENLAF